MLRISKSFKILISAIIFIVSIIYALNSSGIIRKRAEDITIDKNDAAKSQSYFEQASNINKTRIVLKSTEANIYTEIDEKLRSIPKLISVFSVRKQKYGILTFEFPDSLKNEILPEVRKLGLFVSEDQEKQLPRYFDINIEERIRINEDQKKKLEEIVRTSSYDATVKNIGQQINRIQTKIDSLSGISKFQKDSEKKHLLQLTVLESSIHQKGNVKIVGDFAVDLLIAIAVQLLAVLIFIF
ncbi:MAG: hypothetical protein PHR06_06365, partial [Candidatus Cloacimonetes bacterium]|nr:hypothetical protein [Candidatus Cloacimonadota bacterium]